MFDGASYTVPGPHSAALPKAGASPAAATNKASAAGATTTERFTLFFITKVSLNDSYSDFPASASSASRSARWASSTLTSIP